MSGDTKERSEALAGIRHGLLRTVDAAEGEVYDAVYRDVLERLIRGQSQTAIVYWPGRMTLEELKKEAIWAAFRAADGVCTRAAAMLGVSARTMYRWRDEYGLSINLGLTGKGGDGGKGLLR